MVSRQSLVVECHILRYRGVDAVSVGEIEISNIVLQMSLVQCQGLWYRLTVVRKNMYFSFGTSLKFLVL